MGSRKPFQPLTGKSLSLIAIERVYDMADWKNLEKEEKPCV
jgi:hypothetical protein